MIISSKPIQNVAKVYGEQNQVAKNTKAGKNQITQAKDEFILSSSAQEFGQIFNSIRGMAEVRTEKVNELSEQINGGAYKIDSKSIAEKMLGSYIG